MKEVKTRMIDTSQYLLLFALIVRNLEEDEYLLVLIEDDGRNELDGKEDYHWPTYSKAGIR